MADLELRVGDEKAVSLLLSELASPAPELQARLERLRATLSAEDDELVELRRIQRDNDLQLASRDRAVLIFFMGLILGAMPLINSALIRYEVMAYSFQNYFIQFGLVLAAVGLVVLKMRSRVLKNAVNYRFILAIFATLVGALIARVSGFALGLDVGECFIVERGWYTSSIVILSVTLDKRLLPAALAFGLGAVAMFFWRSWPLEIEAASNAAALWLIALVWWVRADEG